MPRRPRPRSRKGVSVGQIVGISAAVLGFAVAAFLMVRIVAGDFLSGGSKDAASEFKMASYSDGLSLRGNVYHITGTVEERLKWTPDRGRLISLDVTDESGSGIVSILIPNDFSEINIDRGATMGFTVRVANKGILVAEAVDEN